MSIEKLKILELELSSISFSASIEKVKDLALKKSPSYVCFANAHMMIEARKNSIYAEQVNSATLVLADGMPLAKACNFFKNKKQDRIAGMDFMPLLFESIDKEKDKTYKVFLYGSSVEVLESLKTCIWNNYPNVDLVGAISPPFRPMSDSEIEKDIQLINQSDANIVFVGLGCPKQEKWMASYYQRINGILLGVGGAFLTMSGIQSRAPHFMQKMGLEWIHRLMLEPKRLAKRYIITNSRFLLILIKAMIKKIINGQA
jgi:N-acetylglucosaminyldiphosphoundecaprenol N-acetyl-beta-D-mannosaminyltransferase